MHKDNAHRERTTDLGLVRINNEAIMTIASIAAMEVRGASKMGGGLRGAIFDSIFNRPSSGGVRINTKDGEVKLVVSVIVDYDVNIPQVADEVQENVKRAVEKMTGLVLAEVNVVIEGVRRIGTDGKEKKA